MARRAKSADGIFARKRTIIGRLVNFCWFFFRLGIALVVLGGIVGTWLYLTRFDEAIRSQVQARLAANYPNLQVTVRAAQRIDGEGIIVRGVSLVEPGADGPLAELVYLDELMLTCPTDLRDLVHSDLPITKVTLRRPTLRATRRPDGSWSVEKLLPLPHCGEHRPVVTIENATVELFDPVKNPSASYTLRNVSLVIRPTSPTGTDGPPTVMVAAAAAPGASARPATFTGPVDIEGSLSGDNLHRLDVRGRYDPATGRLNLGGQIDQLEVGPELYNALPELIAARVQQLSPLRGMVELNYRVDYDRGRPDPYRFDVQGRLTRGRIEDPRLPYPLTDVTMRLQASNQGFRIDEATARGGQTTLSLSCQGQGLGGPGSRISIVADAQRFPLDRQLVDALPPDLQKAWFEYLPAGEANLRLAMQYDGQQWQPRLDIECVDVSFSHHKFPYRLERVGGRMNYANNKLTFRLRGYGDGRPVDLDGEVSSPGPAAVGAVTINTMQLPISTRLIDALPGKTQPIVRSLSPQGSINALVRLWRQTPDEKWHQQVVVDLNRISVKYEKFPYPLSDVRGRLEGVDGQWQFRDLVGVNDSGYVACGGQFVPSATGGELLLRFDATDLPLSEELRGALSPKMQALWLRLKPHGTINATSELRFVPPAKKPEVAVHVDLSGDGVSAEPDFFPYRFEKVHGALDFRDGRLDFRQMTAEHGRTRIAAEGHCLIGAESGWDLRMESLTVDRLAADRDLLVALPPRLRKAIGELNVDGAMNLRGKLAFMRGQGPEDPVTSQWDLQLTMLQGHLHAGMELKNIAGSVRLAGEFDGARQQSRGWLDLDSVTWSEHQFTEVRGPIYFNDEQFLLGSWADPAPAGQPPHRAMGHVYGGTVAADARITLQGTPEYALAADLAGADLARFVTETTRSATKLRGQVGANLQLTGSAAGVHRLNGGGSVRLSDGDIYELPLLLSLLKLLSVHPPDSKAFSTGDMNFRIRGDHVYFDTINFYGDAISLLGKGEMDFEKNVKMTFHAIVGSDQLHVPILRPVLGMASQQLMLLTVEGPLDHPRTKREALPGVRRAVQEIQGELEDPGHKNAEARPAPGILQTLLPGAQ